MIPYTSYSASAEVCTSAKEMNVSDHPIPDPELPKLDKNTASMSDMLAWYWKRYPHLLRVETSVRVPAQEQRSHF